MSAGSASGSASGRAHASTAEDPVETAVHWGPAASTVDEGRSPRRRTHSHQKLTPTLRRKSVDGRDIHFNPAGAPHQGVDAFATPVTVDEDSGAPCAADSQPWGAAASSSVSAASATVDAPDATARRRSRIWIRPGGFSMETSVDLKDAYAATRPAPPPAGASAVSAPRASSTTGSEHADGAEEAVSAGTANATESLAQVPSAVEAAGSDEASARVFDHGRVTETLRALLAIVQWKQPDDPELFLLTQLRAWEAAEQVLHEDYAPASLYVRSELKPNAPLQPQRQQQQQFFSGERATPKGGTGTYAAVQPAAMPQAHTSAAVSVSRPGESATVAVAPHEMLGDINRFLFPQERILRDYAAQKRTEEAAARVTAEQAKQARLAARQLAAKQGEATIAANRLARQQVALEEAALLSRVVGAYSADGAARAAEPTDLAALEGCESFQLLQRMLHDGLRTAATDYGFWVAWRGPVSVGESGPAPPVHPSPLWTRLVNESAASVALNAPELIYLTAHELLIGRNHDRPLHGEEAQSPLSEKGAIRSARDKTLGCASSDSNLRLNRSVGKQAEEEDSAHEMDELFSRCRDRGTDALPQFRLVTRLSHTWLSILAHPQRDWRKLVRVSLVFIIGYEGYLVTPWLVRQVAAGLQSAVLSALTALASTVTGQLQASADKARAAEARDTDEEGSGIDMDAARTAEVEDASALLTRCQAVFSASVQLLTQAAVQVLHELVPPKDTTDASDPETESARHRKALLAVALEQDMVGGVAASGKRARFTVDADGASAEVSVADVLSSFAVIPTVTLQSVLLTSRHCLLHNSPMLELHRVLNPLGASTVANAAELLLMSGFMARDHLAALLAIGLRCVRPEQPVASETSIYNADVWSLAVASEGDDASANGSPAAVVVGNRRIEEELFTRASLVTCFAELITDAQRASVEQLIRDHVLLPSGAACPALATFARHLLPATVVAGEAESRGDKALAADAAVGPFLTGPASLTHVKKSAPLRRLHGSAAAAASPDAAGREVSLVDVMLRYFPQCSASDVRLAVTTAVHLIEGRVQLPEALFDFTRSGVLPTQLGCYCQGICSYMRDHEVRGRVILFSRWVWWVQRCLLSLCTAKGSLAGWLQASLAVRASISSRDEVSRLSARSQHQLLQLLSCFRALLSTDDSDDASSSAAADADSTPITTVGSFLECVVGQERQEQLAQTAAATPKGGFTSLRNWDYLGLEREIANGHHWFHEVLRFGEETGKLALYTPEVQQLNTVALKHAAATITLARARVGQTEQEQSLGGRNGLAQRSLSTARGINGAVGSFSRTEARRRRPFSSSNSPAGRRAGRAEATRASMESKGPWQCLFAEEAVSHAHGSGRRHHSGIPKFRGRSVAQNNSSAGSRNSARAPFVASTVLDYFYVAVARSAVILTEILLQTGAAECPSYVLEEAHRHWASLSDHTQQEAVRRALVGPQTLDALSMQTTAEQHSSETQTPTAAVESTPPRTFQVGSAGQPPQAGLDEYSADTCCLNENEGERHECAIRALQQELSALFHSDLPLSTEAIYSLTIRLMQAGLLTSRLPSFFAGIQRCVDEASAATVGNGVAAKQSTCFTYLCRHLLLRALRLHMPARGVSPLSQTQEDGYKEMFACWERFLRDPASTHACVKCSLDSIPTGMARTTAACEYREKLLGHRSNGAQWFLFRPFSSGATKDERQALSVWFALHAVGLPHDLLRHTVVGIVQHFADQQRSAQTSEGGSITGDRALFCVINQVSATYKESVACCSPSREEVSRMRFLLAPLLALPPLATAAATVAPPQQPEGEFGSGSGTGHCPARLSRRSILVQLQRTLNALFDGPALNEVCRRGGARRLLASAPVALKRLILDVVSRVYAQVGEPSASNARPAADWFTATCYLFLTGMAAVLRASEDSQCSAVVSPAHTKLHSQRTGAAAPTTFNFPSAFRELVVRMLVHGCPISLLHEIIDSSLDSLCGGANTDSPSPPLDVYSHLKASPLANGDGSHTRVAAGFEHNAHASQTTIAPLLHAVVDAHVESPLADGHPSGGPLLDLLIELRAGKAADSGASHAACCSEAAGEPAPATGGAPTAPAASAAAAFRRFCEESRKVEIPVRLLALYWQLEKNRSAAIGVPLRHPWQRLFSDSTAGSSSSSSADPSGDALDAACTMAASGAALTPSQVKDMAYHAMLHFFCLLATTHSGDARGREAAASPSSTGRTSPSPSAIASRTSSRGRDRSVKETASVSSRMQSRERSQTRRQRTLQDELKASSAATAGSHLFVFLSLGDCAYGLDLLSAFGGFVETFLPGGRQLAPAAAVPASQKKARLGGLGSPWDWSRVMGQVSACAHEFLCHTLSSPSDTGSLPNLHATGLARSLQGLADVEQTLYPEGSCSFLYSSAVLPVPSKSTMAEHLQRQSSAVDSTTENGNSSNSSSSSVGYYFTELCGTLFSYITKSGSPDRGQRRHGRRQAFQRLLQLLQGNEDDMLVAALLLCDAVMQHTEEMGEEKEDGASEPGRSHGSAYLTKVPHAPENSALRAKAASNDLDDTPALPTVIDTSHKSSAKREATPSTHTTMYGGSCASSVFAAAESANQMQGVRQGSYACLRTITGATQLIVSRCHQVMVAYRGWVCEKFTSVLLDHRRYNSVLSATEHLFNVDEGDRPCFAGALAGSPVAPSRTNGPHFLYDSSCPIQALSIMPMQLLAASRAIHENYVVALRASRGLALALLSACDEHMHSAGTFAGLPNARYAGAGAEAMALGATRGRKSREDVISHASTKELAARHAKLISYTGRLLRHGLFGCCGVLSHGVEDLTAYLCVDGLAPCDVLAAAAAATPMDGGTGSGAQGHGVADGRNASFPANRDTARLLACQYVRDVMTCLRSVAGGGTLCVPPKDEQQAVQDCLALEGVVRVELEHRCAREERQAASAPWTSSPAAAAAGLGRSDSSRTTFLMEKLLGRQLRSDSLRAFGHSRMRIIHILRVLFPTAMQSLVPELDGGAGAGDGPSFSLAVSRALYLDPLLPVTHSVLSSIVKTLHQQCTAATRTLPVLAGAPLRTTTPRVFVRAAYRNAMEQRVLPLSAMLTGFAIVPDTPPRAPSRYEELSRVWGLCMPESAKSHPHDARAAEHSARAAAVDITPLEWLLRQELATSPAEAELVPLFLRHLDELVVKEAAFIFFREVSSASHGQSSGVVVQHVLAACTSRLSVKTQQLLLHFLSHRWTAVAEAVIVVLASTKRVDESAQMLLLSFLRAVRVTLACLDSLRSGMCVSVRTANPIKTSGLRAHLLHMPFEEMITFVASAPLREKFATSRCASGRVSFHGVPGGHADEDRLAVKTADDEENHRFSTSLLGLLRQLRAIVASSGRAADAPAEERTEGIHKRQQQQQQLESPLPGSPIDEVADTTIATEDQAVRELTQRHWTEQARATQLGFTLLQWISREPQLRGLSAGATLDMFESLYMHRARRRNGSRRSHTFDSVQRFGDSSPVLSSSSGPVQGSTGPAAADAPQQQVALLLVLAQMLAAQQRELFGGEYAMEMLTSITRLPAATPQQLCFVVMKTSAAAPAPAATTRAEALADVAGAGARHAAASADNARDATAAVSTAIVAATSKVAQLCLPPDVIEGCIASVLAHLIPSRSSVAGGGGGGGSGLGRKGESGSQRGAPGAHRSADSRTGFSSSRSETLHKYRSNELGESNTSVSRDVASSSDGSLEVVATQLRSLLHSILSFFSDCVRCPEHFLQVFSAHYLSILYQASIGVGLDYMEFCHVSVVFLAALQPPVRKYASPDVARGLARLATTLCRSLYEPYRIVDHDAQQRRRAAEPDNQSLGCAGGGDNRSSFLGPARSRVARSFSIFGDSFTADGGGATELRRRGSLGERGGGGRVFAGRTARSTNANAGTAEECSSSHMRVVRRRRMSATPRVTASRRRILLQDYVRGTLPAVEVKVAAHLWLSWSEGWMALFMEALPHFTASLQEHRGAACAYPSQSAHDTLRLYFILTTSLAAKVAANSWPSAEHLRVVATDWLERVLGWEHDAGESVNSFVYALRTALAVHGASDAGQCRTTRSGRALSVYNHSPETQRAWEVVLRYMAGVLRALREEYEAEQVAKQHRAQLVQQMQLRVNALAANADAAGGDGNTAPDAGRSTGAGLTLSNALLQKVLRGVSGEPSSGPGGSADARGGESGGGGGDDATGSQSLHRSDSLLQRSMASLSQANSETVSDVEDGTVRGEGGLLRLKRHGSAKRLWQSLSLRGLNNMLRRSQRGHDERGRRHRGAGSDGGSSDNSADGAGDQLRGLAVLSMDEVLAAHTPDKSWTVIDGIVYDVTDLVFTHPGGTRAIVDNCVGQDCTAAFYTQHRDDMGVIRQLQKLRIGILDTALID